MTETWYAPLGTQALPSFFFQMMTWLTLTLFYSKVKFGHRLLYEGKVKLDLCEAIVACNIQSCYICSHLNDLL